MNTFYVHHFIRELRKEIPSHATKDWGSRGQNDDFKKECVPAVQWTTGSIHKPGNLKITFRTNLFHMTFINSILIHVLFLNVCCSQVTMFKSETVIFAI